jgi:hypothetical protein
MRARGPFLSSLLLAVAVGCSRDAASPPPPTTTVAPVATPADLMRPLPSPLPMVAGRVNGQDIPIRNVAIMVEESIQMGRLEEKRRNELYRLALDQLIRREVLLQEAGARGVKADDLQVQRTYDGMRGQHRDEAAWKEFLKTRGLDDNALRAELRVRHTVQALLELEARQRTITVTDEEIRALYDATDASQFPPSGASAGAKPPFEAVKESVRQELLRRKHMEAAERYVESLKARATIEKFL